VKPLLHPKTETQLQLLVSSPTHAIAVVGKAGAGKQMVATYLAAQLLNVTVDSLTNHAYFQLLGEGDGAISIDTVRSVQHFLSRKTTSAGAINRVATIVNAERLTPEAQNAFLKTLEEPPAGAVLLLTVSDKQMLLPTILSRVQTIELVPPDVSALRLHYNSLGHELAAIDKAVLMSGGLPGLMAAILSDEHDHPLVKAADLTRTILRLDTFGRLALIDSIAKQRQQCMDVCFILQQMSELMLGGNNKSAGAYKQWRTVLTQAYEAEQALLTGAQPKLALTNLMLSL
jgi:DNA polymerase III subunit delta'